MRLTIVAGARPNFMKIAPIIHTIHLFQEEGHKIAYRLVHTGQHYDANMSDTFFEELAIPPPDVNLEAGGGSQAELTAAIMVAFEKDLAAHPADVVMVVGDVTSTLACSIVAKKAGCRVAHVEAGIRSFDLSMPEEINRMVTDSITDYFFTTSESANANLRNHGAPDEHIFFVGNVMIDTLLAHRPMFRKPALFDELGLEARKYLVMTMHRPANVDQTEKLAAFLRVIVENARGLPVVFPMHPRTAKVMREGGLRIDRLHVVDPLGYLEFNYLVENSLAVITDSGGITEETTVLGVPCMTLRDNTERPETCELGTNVLVGTDPNKLPAHFDRLFTGKWRQGTIPPLWDGKTAGRIVSTLTELHSA